METMVLSPDKETATAQNKPSRAARIKIAYIGGGSRDWAIKLMADLAHTPTLEGTLCLYDIDGEAARHNQCLAEGIFSHPESRTRFDVEVADGLSECLDGADFVIISVEPGPTALRHADLEIPARYGILQTVGDTVGPGGILRAMRSAPMFEAFGEAIAETCPDAWVINYTNPMAICTGALLARAPGLKVFGCCHEVFSTQKFLAGLVARWFDVEQPAREEIELEIAGVNHFTWAGAARWRGHDLFPKIAALVAESDCFAPRQEASRRRVEREEWFDSEHLIALDLFRRFGALGAAGDRHLAEFLPWYLTDNELLNRWGVVATPYSWRVKRSEAPRKTLEDVAGESLTPSGEEGTLMIEALLGFRQLTTNVNMANRGQLPGAPESIVVETYAEFRQNAVSPMLAAKLDFRADLLVQRSAADQALLKEAVASRRIDLAFAAVLASPLVTLPTDKAWEMFSEMVDATREMLPGWE